MGDAYQRWTAVSSGVANTAGLAAGGLWGATKLGIVPPTAPPVVSPAGVPPVIATSARMAGVTTLNEGDVVVGMIKDGQILKQVPYGENPMLAPSHEQIAQQIGVWQGPSQLSKGVEAFTVWKENGQVMIRGSGNFNPTVSQQTQVILRQQFR